MHSDDASLLQETIAHFQEVARQNRFPENYAVAHDTSRCLICHPERIAMDPFAIYLEVVTQSIKIRRPKLDEGLVDEINGDLAMQGKAQRVSIESLACGAPEDLAAWAGWIREALTTGLDLLSIHSTSSQEFALEDAEARGLDGLVEAKVAELMDFQKAGRNAA